MRTIASLLLFVLFLNCNTWFDNEQEIEGQVWIEVASAERQCIKPDYYSLEDAVTQLQDNYIGVYDSNTISLPVCAACTCATGIIFQAEIDSVNLARAENLGWKIAYNYSE